MPTNIKQINIAHNQDSFEINLKNQPNIFKKKYFIKILDPS